MAPIKCKECGEQVSGKATACPKCGATVPAKTSMLTWIILLLIIFAAYSAYMNPGQKVPSSSSSISRAASSNGLAAPSEPTWETTSSKDEMTGEVSFYATSPTVASKRRMEFPYSNTKAWLGVGCSKSRQWAFIGFSQAPNLNNTQIKNGYNLVSTRFKWNDAVETITFTQQWGDKFLSFVDDPIAITMMASSSIAVLELDWHGQSTVHFEFPLKGSSAAINQIRRKCRAN